MSRSGYSEDYEHIHLYREAVDSAIAGKRGQAMLRDLAAALDAMPDRRLGASSFQRGCPCTLGVLAAHRGLDVSDLEPEHEDDWIDSDIVGARFGVARSMAAEIMYENDECGWFYSRGPETPAERWERMRHWVERHLRGEGGVHAE